MIRFRIQCGAAVDEWRRSGSKWVAGPSAVAPFAHTALRYSVVRRKDEIIFRVHERRPSGDFVELAVRAEGTVRISAGPGGVAPVYLAVRGAQLFGTWEPSELSAHVDVDLVSPTVVARLLSRRQRHSSDTLFRSITRVTAGATVEWDGVGRLTVRYPAPAVHVKEPRRLRPGADPVGFFASRMADAVRGSVEQHRGGVALELSGGLDSANVAVSVAALSNGRVLSGGLLVGGKIGRAQIARRRCVTERLGLRDLTVAASDHLPLEPGGPRSVDQPHYADGDVYQEAFDALRSALRDAGARIVFTGYGGDEIMGRTSGEQRSPARLPAPPPWLDTRTLDALRDVDRDCSPVTQVALPTLMVFAARHPAYLRAGLWPIAPFTDPEVARLGRSLPVDWRDGKTLLRARLARTGFPASVTHPLRPESFAPVMRRALLRNGATLLAGMLDESPLIAQGFVRRDAVEALHTRARTGCALPPLVYDMLSLDIGIRSMCGTK